MIAFFYILKFLLHFRSRYRRLIRTEQFLQSDLFQHRLCQKKIYYVLSSQSQELKNLSKTGYIIQLRSDIYKCSKFNFFRSIPISEMKEMCAHTYRSDVLKLQLNVN